MYRFLLTAPFNVPCPVSYGTVGETGRGGGGGGGGKERGKEREKAKLVPVAIESMPPKNGH